MDSPSIEEPAAVLLNFFEPGIKELPPENGERAETDSQVIALVPAGQLPEGESEEEKESAEDEETDGGHRVIDLHSSDETAAADGRQEEEERGGLRVVVVHEALFFRPGRRGVCLHGQLQLGVAGVVGVEDALFDDQAAGGAAVGLRHADIDEDDLAAGLGDDASGDRVAENDMSHRVGFEDRLDLFADTRVISPGEGAVPERSVGVAGHAGAGIESLADARVEGI